MRALEHPAVFVCFLTLDRFSKCPSILSAIFHRSSVTDNAGTQHAHQLVWVLEESIRVFSCACVFEKSLRCDQTDSCHPWEEPSSLEYSETLSSRPSQYFTAPRSDSHRFGFLEHDILSWWKRRCT